MILDGFPCGRQEKTSAPERVAVGVGSCAVGFHFGVTGAHGNDAVSDDDQVTSSNVNVGAYKRR